jgi:porin
VRRPGPGCLLALVFLALPAVGLAETTEPVAGDDEQGQPAASQADEPRFGGPDQVEVQIRLDRETERSFLTPYYEWKDRLTENRGLSFGVDYSAAYLGADESPGDDTAASGMVRFFGSWDLTGRGTKNTGALNWKIEHRHAYTDVAPGGFGLNLGYVGLIEPPFSDQGLRLTNLYWRHRVKDGKVAVVGGWVDATDYVDVYGLASPWTGFLNFAFSTGSATIPVPTEGLGVAAGGMVTDRIFLIGGLADANSDPTDPVEGFDTFFSTREYFKHFEVGWTPSQGQIYLDNAHLTIWQADEREEAETPSGWGANISYSRYLKQKWMPFFRAGYAKDGGSLLQKSVSVGFGYQRIPGQSLLGLGFNWGEPNESTFEPGLDDQYTLELFYRWQIAREIALTPDVQYLKNPALNPDQDAIWIFGLRARLAF